ncbi:tlde1 domain-containing protein [Robbsia andropogonis]|uniref:tlde1 domain-containing protein n=2 Tax=Robbsia andropogonis TaxID=28092 RepID=UPI001FC8BFBE|nr:tlde1 domain-containing protein [Robbsia andropogonis]
MALRSDLSAGKRDLRIMIRPSESGKPKRGVTPMPWQYSQRTGQLTRGTGPVVGLGYSGRGVGQNNPQMQNQVGMGPIPTGSYSIGAPFHHSHAGGYTMRLTPNVGTDTRHRSGFMIHGDSTAHPGQASDGCIVLDRRVRVLIWNSGDRQINVVP